MLYTPSQKILDNYARVLINYGLNGGRGIRTGEVVFLEVPESAKPLLLSLYKVVLESGGHPIIQYLPDEIDSHFFTHASAEQINYFPAKFLKGKISEADHFVRILAETNLHELEGIDPHKIMQKNSALKPYLDWRQRKESKGRFSWTLGLYPTPAMAREAHMSLRTCWQQVVQACYLDNPQPIKKWQQIESNIKTVITKLNELPIISLNIKAAGTDLTIGLDKNRRWLGGGGCNIPSFEIFISPDFHRTSGHISFNLPLYRYGNEIRDIYLEFIDGHVVKSTASKGESVLRKMIATPNADLVGEFSLTDRRFSHINRFMAETLYDENFGGRYGNTHLALGMSFHECYPHSQSKLTATDWQNLGYSDSVIHTDIISTSNRRVVATLADGSQNVIYQNGQFTLL
ncbi:MAG: aminopeptidase [Microgenomates group bacterium]